MQSACSGCFYAVPCWWRRISTKRYPFNSTILSLQNACANIEKQTGFSFSYSEKTLLAYGKNVTLTVSNATVRTVLDRIFDKSPVAWSIKGNLIFLVPAPDQKPASAVVQTQPAPIVTVKGQILNAEDSAAVSGVTIMNNRKKLSGSVMPVVLFPSLLKRIPNWSLLRSALKGLYKNLVKVRKI